MCYIYNPTNKKLSAPNISSLPPRYYLIKNAKNFDIAKH